MEKIASFQVDHTKFSVGLYISRIDDDIVTYDVRMVKPNGGVYLETPSMHTIEHLFATYARNSEFGSNIVYVGPMGCLTGMYVIMAGIPGSYTVEAMRYFMLECLDWILEQEEVPATTPETCGNYLLHDLPMAKWECKRYKERLLNDFHSEYTKLNVELDNGMQFADA